MSDLAVKSVLRYSRSQGTARLLLLVIAYRADDSGRVNCVSRAELMSDTGISKSAFHKWVRRLEEVEQELRSTPIAGTHSGVFRILLPGLLQEPVPASREPDPQARVMAPLVFGGDGYGYC